MVIKKENSLYFLQNKEFLIKIHEKEFFHGIYVLPIRNNGHFKNLEAKFELFIK
jgi:hypothetical protein